MQKAIYILSFLCCIMGMQQSASAQCGVYDWYCYNNNASVEFSSTTPLANEAVSITLGGSVEAGFDYVSVRQNGVTIAGPFTGALSGTYTGAVGATISLYLTSDGSISCFTDEVYPAISFSISCAVPPPPAGVCGVSSSYCYGDNNTGTEFASTTPTYEHQAVSITLAGSVEPGYDYVYVLQNGVTIAGPFTGALSGTYTGAVGANISLYLTSDGSVSCVDGGWAPIFSISCATPPPAGGCGVSGSYCYDDNISTGFASTTPLANQAVSITLGGSVESGYDYVSVLQNGVTIAGPLTGVLSGTYTGAVGATMSLYLTSDGSFSCTSAYAPTFSISCAAPPPPLSVTLSNIVNATCNIGGSVKANPVGGISPYTRLWSNGGTTATISNLAAGTYTVTVTSGNGATATASTTLTNSAIAVPTNLTTTNITGTTATFNWSAVTGAANYTILGRKVGSATWTTVGPVTGTSKNIQSQIACGKTYEWKVRANCAGGLTSSAYSSTLNFTTSACPSKTDSELVAEWDGGFKTFSLSPNPANSLVTLYYGTETETPLNISIIDLTGRIILQQNTLATQGDNPINLTTNQLPQGYYVVELNDGTTKMHEKLVIAR